MSTKNIILQTLNSARALSVFVRLNETALFRAFCSLLRDAASVCESGCWSLLIRAWADFTAALWAEGGDFGAAVFRLARADVNPWTLALEKTVPPDALAASAAAPLNAPAAPAAAPLDTPAPPNAPAVAAPHFAALNAAAENDLCCLARIATFDFFSIGAIIPAEETDLTLARIYQESILINTRRETAAERFLPWGFSQEIREKGAGCAGLHTMFYWDGGLVPAATPDTVSLANLSGGYEAERALVVENTRRFLEGGAANNLLLYGDRGTGKSATVKAVCSHFAPHGLRLLQINKQDFEHWRAIFAALKDRAHKFVLFIDDLSFETQDDVFTRLKGLLEGGIEPKPANVVVYATSNRRHFVKEKFTDRPADSGDVRAFDTMQEQLSLSDRFGLTVIFAAPSQEDYLAIAAHIAREYGLWDKAGGWDDSGGRALFNDNALKWERWFNGRSPRTARQYVEWLAAGNTRFPWD